ncbi:hypothetical protein EV361DRAFT_927882 [Lentinula raphanica]|nr:hypothetical protein EV361DRAFT_927882 [Lentinula raphanica]
MNTTVSQTLIRDSEGWFVLMDVEESPAVVWHHQEGYSRSSSPQLMGWRDSQKVIESEDETADHGNRSDSDTESQISMSCPTNSSALANRIETEGLTKSVVEANDRTPIVSNATKQLPEQKADEIVITPNVEEPNGSRSSRDSSSGKRTYMAEDPVISSASNGVTGLTYVPPCDVVVPYCSPKSAETEVIEEIDPSDFPLDPTISSDSRESQAQVPRSFLLEELLDRLGEFVMTRLPVTRALFKVGALMYLLFLARVLQKIWAMFQSQPLAVAFGTLSLSIALLFLIRLYVPEHIKVQVDESRSVPETVVDTCIFVGAFTCVSIIWQMASIIGDLIFY